jgi:Domain of unknown function (DUF1906)/Putative peptidoglycan binding domain
VNELGIDYAWQHPDPAKIAAAGYKFVLRYLSTDPSKNVTQGEVKALQGAGLSVGVVWETAAMAPLVNNGTTDGNMAAGQAAALGYPKNCPVFVNIGDWGSPTQVQQITVISYYSAFSAAVSGHGYRWGGYGPAFFLEAVYQAGLGGYLWQNGIDGPGMPGSIVYAQTSLYQRTLPTTELQGAYDEDVMLNPVPLWGVAVVPTPPPPPPPTPPKQEVTVNVPQVSMTTPGPSVVNGWVKSVQGILNAKDNAGLVTDGRFGGNTDKAVRKFQSQRGLSVDGIVGPNTANQLCNY